MEVRRFCERLGIPRSTWYYWRAGHVCGREVKRWPAPVVDQIEDDVTQVAEKYPAFGHRKVWGKLRRAGSLASQSSVKRAMAKNQLLHSRSYKAEVRERARKRRAAFVEAKDRRNSIWQLDFTEFETTTGSIWQLAPVVDRHAKVVLACHISGRQAASDAIAALSAAIDSAEEMLGFPLLDDCTDTETGEVTPVIVVTDNGPAFKSKAFANFIAARPYLDHARTRYRAPQTNGVVERFNESLKYDRLYREEIATMLELEGAVSEYVEHFNTDRPHEALDMAYPIEAYQADPDRPFVAWPKTSAAETYLRLKRAAPVQKS